MRRPPDAIVFCQRSTMRLARRQHVSRTGQLLLLLAAMIPAAEVAADHRAEAYVGEPYGVGQITLDLSRGGDAIAADDERIDVADIDGRVQFIALQQAPVRRVLRQLLELPAAGRATYYFLFRGRDPLQLTVHAPHPVQLRVDPMDGPRAHRRILNQWWRSYTSVSRDARHAGSLSAIAPTYLTSVLARRLHRAPPSDRPALFGADPQQSYLAALFATETYRASLVDGFVRAANASSGVADQRLATTKLEITGEPLPPPDGSATTQDEAIEPLATRIPEECFYIRFGTFANYSWLRDLTERFDGDVQNMVAMRGLNHRTSERLQNQIALYEPAVAKLLGPAVIRDVAIIGLDLNMLDGAAIGVIFDSRNRSFIENDITRQRAEAMEKHPDATLETLEILGREVKFLWTEDHRIRSFYVIDGDAHLISNSRQLVERFLQASDGERSLADSAEFVAARSSLPASRRDTVFAYFSRAFFDQWTAPRHRLEAQRRVRSSVEITVAKLAQQLARREGLPADSAADLVAAQVVANQFGDRPDGSRLVFREGRWQDTERGYPGSFLPVADHPVKLATRAELRWLEQQQQMLASEVGRLPGVAVAMKREPSAGPGSHRVTIDVLVQSQGDVRYGKWRDWLGEPTPARIAPVDGDVVSVSAHVRIPWSQFSATDQPFHFRAALRDFNTPLFVEEGQLPLDLSQLELVRGYIATWPRGSILQSFLGGAAAPPAPNTGAPVPVGEGGNLLQQRSGEFGAFSFKEDVLAQVTPQLAMVDAPVEAQLHLAVEDLTDKQLAKLVRGFGYVRARDTSLAGSRLLNTISREFGVSPEKCREFTEDLLGGTLVCPLGGQYELVDAAGRRALWTSSAVIPANRFLLTEIPQDYEFPLLGWLRGAEGYLAVAREQADAHFEVHVDSWQRRREQGSQDGEQLPEPSPPQ